MHYCDYTFHWRIFGLALWVAASPVWGNFRAPSAGISGVQETSCPFAQGLHANLLRFISGEGFHRQLKETLEVTVTNSPIPLNHFDEGRCAFVLYNELDEHVFVDPYEVSKSSHLRRTIKVLNSWTDLESPAWWAMSNSTVFVQLHTKATGNLLTMADAYIPIHFRYQKPLSHSRLRTQMFTPKNDHLLSHIGNFNPESYSAVLVPLPKLLLRCNYWDPLKVKDYCKVFSTLCDLKSTGQECSWVVIPFQANRKASTVYIPMGDMDSLNVVTGVTMAVVMGGMCFLMLTLIQSKRKLVERTSLKKD